MSKYSKNNTVLSTYKQKEALTGYLMIVPDGIGIFVFVFLPILYAFFISLHQWNGISEMIFIGVGNYIKALNDQVFWQSIGTTFKYTLIFVPSVYCLSLFLALLVKEIGGKGMIFYRTTFFLPYSISSVVAAVAWSFMYNPTKGYLNGLLKLIGLPKRGFLTSLTQALPSVAIVGIWLAVGYNMILFINALNDVPKMYYEAAEIDGANWLQKFIKITLPQISGTTLFILVVTTISSFQVFDQIKIMTNGGPMNATNVSVLYILKQAFELNHMGYASSIAFLLFILIFSISIIQALVNRKSN